MSKNKPKKELDPNVVGASLETTSDELTAKTEEVVEAPVEEAPVEEKKEEEPIPVPVEPGPVIIDEPKVEEPKDEAPAPVVEEKKEEVKEEPTPVVEKKKEEPIPVPVEPDPVIIEDHKVEEIKEEVKAPVEKSEFKEAFVVCIYATGRRSVDDISDELNTNRRFVAENIIIDRVKNRVVLETSNNVVVLRKIQKKYLAAGIKTVIAKA